MNWLAMLNASVIRGKWYAGEIDDLEMLKQLSELKDCAMLKVPCAIDVKLYYEAITKRED